MNNIQNFAQIISLLAVSCCFFFGSCIDGEMSKKGKTPIEYVDPFEPQQVPTWEALIQEMDGGAPSPMIGLPFGMTHWTLQNILNATLCRGDFRQPLGRVLSFRPTHFSLKTCMPDYGSFGLRVISHKKGASFPLKGFILEKELAGPNSFQGHLPELEAKIEVAVSSRSAIFEVKFPKKDTVYLAIGPHLDSRYTKFNFYPASGEIWIQDSLPEIFPGLNMYYLIQTKNIYTEFGTRESNLLEVGATQLVSNRIEEGFYLEFPVDTSESLQFKIAGSYWDIPDARLNLNEEIPNWDLKKVKSSGREAWEKLFETITIEDKEQISAQEAENFYRSFFWASLIPRTFSGTDGLYPSFSGERIPERMESGNFYGDLLMWEDGRSTQAKFLSLLKPELREDLKFSHKHGGIPSLAEDQKKKNLAELASLEVFRYLGLKESANPGLFQLQKPVFSSWTLHKGKSKEFQFTCNCPTDQNAKIISASLNGEKLEQMEVNIDDIIQGGKLEVSCE
ncbi:MAG: glycoside hydrolase domain-containing protein [Bacteroidota bacterium]